MVAKNQSGPPLWFLLPKRARKEFLKLRDSRNPLKKTFGRQYSCGNWRCQKRALEKQGTYYNPRNSPHVKSGKNRVKTRNPIPHGDGRVGCLFKAFRDLCCLRPLSPYVTPELPVSIKNPSTPPPLAAPTANKPQNTTFYRPSFPSTTQTGNETMDTRKPTKRLRLTRIYSLNHRAP